MGSHRRSRKCGPVNNGFDARSTLGDLTGQLLLLAGGQATAGNYFNDTYLSDADTASMRLPYAVCAYVSPLWL